jgi:hypothetical protein
MACNIVLRNLSRLFSDLYYKANHWHIPATRHTGGFAKNLKVYQNIKTKICQSGMRQNLQDHITSRLVYYITLCSWERTSMRNLNNLKNIVMFLRSIKLRTNFFYIKLQFCQIICNFVTQSLQNAEIFYLSLLLSQNIILGYYIVECTGEDKFALKCENSFGNFYW